jgi:hypothetical protein
MQFILIENPAKSQNAPVTTCANISAPGPGAISVPVTVTGFSDIGAISLSLDYDHTVVQFLSATPNPLFPTMAFGEADLGNGTYRIIIGWFGPGKFLTDGSTLFTINFSYNAGSTVLAWYDDGSSCEYADGDYNVLNDIPTVDYYINGIVCGMIMAPDTIIGPDTLCQGTQGATYSILPLENATGYIWTVPEGALIINGQGTNLIIVDYSLQAVSGNITVSGSNACGNGPATQLPVTVNALPVANAGNDFTINYGTSTMLEAAPGGSGSFSYHWSPEELLLDPDMQNPQTVIMTSTTIFQLIVTSLDSQCQASDEVTLSITGGPLNVNPLALPAFICQGGSSQLFANAGGGSENYTYLWTSNPPGNPPWSSDLPNPVVSPEIQTLYLVQVNDGFTTVSGSTEIEVNMLPTATISGGDSLCGPDAITILPVNLTGTPPWNFIYNISFPFGNTSVYVYNQQTTPYNIIANETGNYTVTYVEDNQCNGPTYGSARVDIFPIPATPEITIEGLLLTSSLCCGNQWYLNNNPITGATGHTYIVTESGAYSDIVTLNGCSSDTSEILDVIVSIPEVQDDAVMIFPNPASDWVIIRTIAKESGKIRIRLLSIDGRLVREEQFFSNANGDHILDLNHLKEGLYLMQLQTRHKNRVIKLQINPNN